jgi:ureidoacrylate peracid hydrolase
MGFITRRDMVSVGIATGLLASATPLLAAAPARSLLLEARPTRIALNAAHAALIVVDMQNDFGTKGGMFDRAGNDLTGIQNVVPAIARSLELARRCAMKVVYLKMGFKPDLSDLGAPDSVNRNMHLAMGVGQSMLAPDGRPGRILVRDTWNTDIMPALAPRAGELVLYKSRFSGFYGTDLHEKLSGMGIKHLLFTGCTTSVCVESTLRDAMFRDYLPVLLADCMSEVVGNDLAVTNHQATLTLVESRFGWVSSSGEFEKAVSA